MEYFVSIGRYLVTHRSPEIFVGLLLRWRFHLIVALLTVPIKNHQRALNVKGEAFRSVGELRRKLNT